MPKLPRRLRTTPDAEPAQEIAPTQPRGESGRLQRNGVIISDDHSPDLSGLNGIREFDRMWRSDSDARKALNMVANPIVSATYDVQPYGGEDATPQDIEVAQATGWALLKHMAWVSYLAQLTRVTFRSGHAPFEKTWQLANWQDRQLWAPTTHLRLPKSVHFFDQDEAGCLAAIRQYTKSGMVTIPAQDLVLHRVGEEGDNWRGESLLRPAYKHFALKEKLEVIDAMAHERFAMGIPIAYPPQGAQSGDLDKLEAILAGIRAHEAGYIVSPWPAAEFMRAEGGQGAHFAILTPDHPHDVQPSLSYHRDGISAAVMEEFMRLGQSGTGARATADVQQDPFLAWCEVLCGLVVEDPINRDLIPHFVQLNFQTDRYPTLKASVIDKTSIQDLSTAMQQLVAAGLIHPDAVLEDWLREHGSLPPADKQARQAREEATAQLQEQALTPSDPATGPSTPPAAESEGTPPQKLSLARQDRPLRPWESVMQLDRIEGAIDQARDRMLAACTPITHRMAASMAADTYQEPKGESELEAAIRDQLEGLFHTGVHTVQQELQAQAPAHSVYGLAVDGGEAVVPENLLLRAELAARRITSDMLLSIKRSILARGRADQAQLQADAEAAARGALRAEAMDNAAPALNAGRLAEADRQSSRIRGARYTSILDGRRCANCAVADDDVLRPLDDPLRLARIPPNPACLGGGACRCMEFYELMDEASPSA